MDKEEIIERLKKVEEENEEIKKENERLRKIIEENPGTNKSRANSNQNVSRREFLKKMGTGAAGLGALSLSPAASQLKLTKNGVFQNGSDVSKSTSEIKDVVGNMTGNGLSYDSSTGQITVKSRGIQLYDAARTFKETDLNLNRSKVVRKGNSLGLAQDLSADWETGDLSYWPDGRGDVGGDGGGREHEVQTSVTQQGSYAVRLGTNSNYSGGEGVNLVSKLYDGPWAYPRRGDNFSFAIRWSNFGSSGNEWAGLRFAWNESNTSGYTIGFNGSGQGDNWQVSGPNSSSSSSGFVPRNNQDSWWIVKVDFDSGGNGDITVTVEDQSGNQQDSITINDTGKDKGGLRLDISQYAGDSTTDAYFDNISSTNPRTSGQVDLEWPYPNDIYEWDIATFAKTLDGETVDVFVAYSTDGGSTWSRTNGGNPISRNYSLADDSNISPSDEVRLEVELSRSDTSNDPTLDSALRSWRV